MRDNLKLSVIIPVFNEEKTIGKIIEKVISVEPKNKEIIVIDDSSSDNTRSILNELKKRFDFSLILNSKNLGKGACIIKALSYVTGDIIIPQDADLELDPADYIKLMEPILKDNVDAVFGSRFKYPNRENCITPTLFANKLFTYFINLLYDGYYTDIMTCYKMCKIEILRSLKLSSQRFNVEPEIACKVLKNKYKVVEVPISYHPRGWKEGKKIKWFDTFSVLNAIIKYRFRN